MSLQSFVIETTEASRCQHLDHHDHLDCRKGLKQQILDDMRNLGWWWWSTTSETSGTSRGAALSFASSTVEHVAHFKTSLVANLDEEKHFYIPIPAPWVFCHFNIANIDHLEITLSADPHDLVNHDNHRITIMIIMISTPPWVPPFCFRSRPLAKPHLLTSLEKTVKTSIIIIIFIVIGHHR